MKENMGRKIGLIILNVMLVMSICACGVDGKNDYEIGNTVTLGIYEQDSNVENGKEPIEWIVIDVEDDQALILSKYVLDTCAFNEQLDSINWEMSTAYQLMNEEFYNNSFSSKEKKIIISSIDKDTSEEIGYIFFLSFNEVLDCFDMTEVKEKSGDYFYSQEILGKMTPYALNQYNEASEFKQKEYDYLTEVGVIYDREVIGEIYSAWWLRRSEEEGYDTTDIVGRWGNLGYVSRVSNNRIGVRPAMWIEIK